MDSKYIEQLLERYWQCETSLEDEAELRAFFSGSDVPKHLLRYKDLFVYQQLQQEVHLGEDFDARVLAEVEVPVVKAKRLTLAARFMPLRFLAGSLGAWLLIALMVVIGIWFPARQAMKIEPAEALHEE